MKGLKHEEQHKSNKNYNFWSSGEAGVFDYQAQEEKLFVHIDSA